MHFLREPSYAVDQRRLNQGTAILLSTWESIVRLLFVMALPQSEEMCGCGQRHFAKAKFYWSEFRDLFLIGHLSALSSPALRLVRGDRDELR